MEINKTNNLKYNYSRAFTGKEDKPAPDENERPNSYKDKSANDAVTNTGKAMISFKSSDTPPEQPDDKKDCPELTYKDFYEMRDKNGKELCDGMYAIEAARRLYRLYNECPDVVLELIDIKDENGGFRLNNYDIETLYSIYKDNKETILELLDKKDDKGNYRLNGQDIYCITNVYKTDPETVDKLLTLKDDKGGYRLNGHNIQFLTDVYKKDSTSVQKLLDIKRDNEYLFGGDSIRRILDSDQSNLDLVDKLAEIKDKNGKYLFSGSDIGSIYSTYIDNPNVVSELLEIDDPRLNGHCISKMAKAYSINPDFISDLLDRKDSEGKALFDSGDIGGIAEAYVKNPEFITSIIEDRDKSGNPRFSGDTIGYVLSLYNFNPDFTNYILTAKDKDGNYRYDKHDFLGINYKYKDSLDTIKELAEIKDEQGNYILDAYGTYALAECYKKEPAFVTDLIRMTDGNGKRRFSSSSIINLSAVYSGNEKFIYNLLNRKDNKGALCYETEEIIRMCKAREQAPEFVDEIINIENKEGSPEFSGYYMGEIVTAYNENPDFVKELVYKKDDDDNYRFNAYSCCEICEAYAENPDFINELINMKKKDGKQRFSQSDITTLIYHNKQNPDLIRKLLDVRGNDGEYWYSGYEIADVSRAYKEDPEITTELLKLKDVDGNPRFKRSISHAVNAKKNYPETFNELVNLKREDGTYVCSAHDISELCKNYDKNPNLCKKLLLDNNFDNYIIYSLMDLYDKDNAKEVEKICNDYKKLEIEPKQILAYFNTKQQVSIEELRKLSKKIGADNMNKLSINDIVVAAKFVDAYNIDDIGEIPIAKKRELLKQLVSLNVDLFYVSDTVRELFPLVPTNQEEYCSILPALVRSIGIETNELTEQKTGKFNKDLQMLSSTLKEVSDEEFASLEIEQDYSKDEFIEDVFSKVKDLSKNERQKVYDYFGFELHKNKKTKTGFDISGYPVNLNNGVKLSKIDNPETKAVVEDLRENVIRFSENNRIKCNNIELEEFINNVVDVLPELRPQIGKVQHGSHDYDVFKHSLKVMQKVSQDPCFDMLNESDKKVMLLATLLHDVTKKECSSDPTHAAQSSFDAVFISKKFNLSKKEELKLYTLIRNHEWLGGVNTSKSSEQLNRRLQSVAYDLQHENTFDMALMFTHADLKAVRKDDSFHDKKEGKSRADFNGNVRSFGESADFYAEKIRKNIAELKKSQPILPTTKLPKASKIDEKITTVNPDGSTNIKGVYKNGDGLVIIKYNEVEDWEAIGLPKGAVSHGIHIPKGTKGDAELNEDVDTGNIKFIVHGLDYENQLAKFDAFSLLDSDALLSVSYAERPESKYRFFRPQGVILDVDTEYIHGGGNTDAGSGCGKNINEFKRNYIFGGRREADRLYISKLIKDMTGMSDEEYVDFIEKNKNKPMYEIEPPEIRDAMIQAFATINSNTRKGNRAYNEMYISNPNSVNAVFAYNIDYKESIGNPVDFLSRTEMGKHEKGYNGADSKSAYDRTRFLQEYALKNDLPFVVFGD